MAENGKEKKEKQPTAEDLQAEMEKRLPKEVQEKLKKIKKKLDRFQKEVVKKFDKYIMGIALLPPPKPQNPEEKIDPDKVHVLVLVDDGDSTKMSKEELRDKLTTIIDSIAKETDKNIVPQTLILTE